MKRWRAIRGALPVLLPIPARLCSCPKRQRVCCTGLMWDTQRFPSWLFDMTPDEPSAVLLSSASPHLVFAFCTIPVQGKVALPLAHGSGQAPGFGHGSIFPSFVQISGWKTRQQDPLATGTCTQGPAPVAPEQLLLQPVPLQGCGLPAHRHRQPPSGCQQGRSVPRCPGWEDVSV